MISHVAKMTHFFTATYITSNPGSFSGETIAYVPVISVASPGNKHLALLRFAAGGWDLGLEFKFED